jgi:hypothetical protein
LLHNIGPHSTDYTALYPRRQNYVTTGVRTSNPGYDYMGMFAPYRAWWKKIKILFDSADFEIPK